MFRRFISYTIIGAGITSAANSLYTNDFNVNYMGIVRLGRSANAVFDIALTYKRELYNNKWDVSSADYKLQKSRVHKIAAERLLELICINKGVYIKVGQHIGGLEYLLPTEFVSTMKVLHANAPQNTIDDINKVIQQDLHKNVDDIFEKFDQKPLGTASLAQVHKATLKTGEVVAVKVQHPYVKGNSRVDIATMEILVKAMSWIFPDFKIQWLVDETKKNLPKELDFLNEGRNAERVALQFKKYPWLRIPKIYWDLSTSRVLVMEYLEGGQVNDLNYIHKNYINPLTVATRIGQLYSEMIFCTGFVHSDPHPGNILVHKNNKGRLDIVLLDHGLYANLTDKFRYEYSNLWLSILNVDREAMRRHSKNLGIHKDLYGLFACMVTGRPWDTLTRGISNIAYSAEEKQILQNNTSLVLPQITDVLQEVDRQMLLILKTNDLIRGIEATLGTQNRMTALWVMSKFCIHSSYNIKMAETRSYIARIGISLCKKWEILKLNLYFLYIGLRNFGLVSAMKQILC